MQQERRSWHAWGGADARQEGGRALAAGGVHSCVTRRRCLAPLVLYQRPTQQGKRESVSVDV
eukprot:1603486-Rhodomonas_salina.1